MIKQPAAAAAALRLRNKMESAPSQPQKDYVHYQHNDGCNLRRWTARESYQFMYARPWQRVNDFYLDVLNGRQSLLQLFGKRTYSVHDGIEVVEDSDRLDMVSVPSKDRTGRWARATFKILLSYHGSSFDGWQKQPGLNTVQGLVERCLGKFIDESKSQLLKEKNLPLEGCAQVAGRTDKGVTALKQVCSFYTWRKDVKAQDIEDAINAAAPGMMRVANVYQVSRDFHPNFSAKWRHYFYIFPLDGEIADDRASQCKKIVLDDSICQDGQYNEGLSAKTCEDALDDCEQSEQQPGDKPLSFDVGHVNHLLHQLEGKSLSFRIFARDTKASRSVGPPTECFVFHARAAEAYLPCSKILNVWIIPYLSNYRDGALVLGGTE